MANLEDIIAASANPEVVISALAIGQATTYQREVNFTRAHELEADRIGIRTMSRARFDPDAVATFFVRLEQQSRLYGNQVPEFLRTHPVNTTRISDPELDASLDALGNEIDQAAQLAAAATMQEKLAAALPEIPLYYRAESTGVGNRLGGYERFNPSSAGPTWDVEKWFVNP